MSRFVPTNLVVAGMLMPNPSVAISRILTNFLVPTIPPLILSQLEKTRLLKNNLKLAVPINFGLITLSLTIALPLAIAAFPQKAVIDPLKLEDTFWNLKDKNGEAIRQVFL
ncbi:7116_t:CDS:2 [Scutellospora calospora]|uniref:7116_t:CDS:1 n=1 Tax=Scutellospora calospora TaxID=85575 RepID=A0ACA9KIF8_9GLOM|nr:7116_t:CDS:2 [Scutellospora calospora]